VHGGGDKATTGSSPTLQGHTLESERECEAKASEAAAECHGLRLGAAVPTTLVAVADQMGDGSGAEDRVSLFWYHSFLQGAENTAKRFGGGVGGGGGDHPQQQQASSSAAFLGIKRVSTVSPGLDGGVLVSKEDASKIADLFFAEAHSAIEEASSKPGSHSRNWKLMVGGSVKEQETHRNRAGIFGRSVRRRGHK
jgi:hypothetical protein